MSEQKKVTNLVFRFKEGASALLAAKLFSLAISRMRYFDNLEEPILIPLPASTKERHRQRFESFCGELSRRLIPSGSSTTGNNKKVRNKGICPA